MHIPRGSCPFDLTCGSSELERLPARSAFTQFQINCLDIIRVRIEVSASSEATTDSSYGLFASDFHLPHG